MFLKPLILIRIISEDEYGRSGISGSVIVVLDAESELMDRSDDRDWPIVESVVELLGVDCRLLFESTSLRDLKSGEGNIDIAVEGGEIWLAFLVAFSSMLAA